MNLSGANVLVLGLGISGCSAARYCAQQGARVCAADERNAEELTNSAELIELEGLAELQLGRPFPDPSTFDLTVPSPGVPASLYQNSANRVWGELELAWRALSVPVIAVTGTNGKSTTVRLIEAMLRQAGLRAEAGGNIGRAALDLVGMPLDVAVLEVSSFQLESVEAFSPDVAVILNISRDHLDRHGSFERYIATKERILEYQSQADRAVMGFDDPIVKSMASRARAEVFSFSTRISQSLPEERSRAWLDGTSAVFERAGKQRRIGLEAEEVSVLRDRDNVLAALTTIWAFGIEPERGVTALASFSPLAHRCEVLGVVGEVTWINDSKATNPGAAERALQNMERPVIWIAGGRGKGLPFDGLARVAKSTVRQALVFGEAAAELADALGPTIPCQRVEDVETAVTVAAALSQPGDVVLLAPACASFDQFKNFEQRGDSFRSAVNRLEGGPIR